MDFAFDARTEELRARAARLHGRARLPGRGRCTPSRSRRAGDAVARGSAAGRSRSCKAEARSRGLWNLFLPDAELRRRA